MLSPRTLTPHNYFTPLRGVSHNFGVNGARNAGAFPVKVSADDPDNLANKEYCTYDKTLFMYWIHYCQAEGLHPSSHVARAALLYLFYAKPTVQGRNVSCVNVIHRCMQSGTYRFAEPEVLFKEVLEMMREDPSVVEWLTDKGVVCPQAKMHVSSIGCACVLTHHHVCPHA